MGSFSLVSVVILCLEVWGVVHTVLVDCIFDIYCFKVNLVPNVYRLGFYKLMYTISRLHQTRKCLIGKFFFVYLTFTPCNGVYANYEIMATFEEIRDKVETENWYKISKGLVTIAFRLVIPFKGNGIVNKTVSLFSHYHRKDRNH